MKIILEKKPDYISYEKDLSYFAKDIEHVVYGISVIKGKVYYYLCNGVYTDYPSTYSSELFRVVDSRLSRFWISTVDNGSNITLELMFMEWINDPMFATNLVDGEDREVKIFQAYKVAMDLEFPDSSITGIAKIGDDEWLICPFCIDAWKNQNKIDALIVCPKCLNKFNNPRYKNEFPRIELNFPM